MDSKRILPLAATVLSAAVLSGCNTLNSKQNLADFDQQYSAGDFTQAAHTAMEAGGITPEGQSDDLLWSLQSGAALSSAGQYQLSNKILDQAEDLMKEEDTESVGRKGVETLAAVLVNDSFNRYSPTVYDGVMTNSYKALNSVFLQDSQSARIEFNRAADRQRRAKEHFKEKIAEQEKEIQAAAQEREQKTAEQEQASTETAGLNYDQSFSKSEEAIYAQYPELEAWKAYPDFVNPYTDYLHGLYFMLSGNDSADYGKARTSMRRVAGMVPKNAAVKTDLKVADKLRRGQWRKHKLNPAVWVIFENGLAPNIDETVIPIPLILVSDDISYAQIALPKLQPREQAYPYLELSSGKKNLGKTQQLADMDRVVQTEFKKEFPFKVTKAVTSTLTKAFIQYQIEKETGLFGGLAAAIYQAATTHADTRSWSALPKEVQVARVRRPGNLQLQVSAPGIPEQLNIQLPEKQFAIVHIKATGPKTMPIYKVVGFDS